MTHKYNKSFYTPWTLNSQFIITNLPSQHIIMVIVPIIIICIPCNEIAITLR